MAKKHGRRAVIFVKEYKLSGDANRVSINFAVDTVEDTCFEAPAKEFLEGKYSWTASMDGYWNSAANKADVELHQMIGVGTQVIGIYPEGTATASVGYEGKGILTNYSPEATIAGAVVFSADIQGDGDLYRSTILASGAKTVDGTSTAYNIGTAGLNRGITSVLRVLTGSHGTCTVTLQAGTTEAGSYGDIFSFTAVSTPGGTHTPDVEYKTTATATVGPWFRATWSETATDSIDMTVSCATEE